MTARHLIIHGRVQGVTKPPPLFTTAIQQRIDHALGRTGANTGQAGKGVDQLVNQRRMLHRRKPLRV